MRWKRDIHGIIRAEDRCRKKCTTHSKKAHNKTGTCGTGWKGRIQGRVLLSLSCLGYVQGWDLSRYTKAKIGWAFKKASNAPFLHINYISLFDADTFWRAKSKALSSRTRSLKDLDPVTPHSLLQVDIWSILQSPRIVTTLLNLASDVQYFWCLQ